MTAPATPWLVTFGADFSGTAAFETLEEATDYGRDHRQDGDEPRFWKLSDVGLVRPADAAPAPPKRARRKRSSSAVPAGAAATPAASVPEKAAGPAEVRTTGAKAIWCGGRACTDRAGVEVHRDDPSCLKLHPAKRAEAVR